MTTQHLNALRAGLAEYDGRSPTILSELAVRHRGHPHFHDDLATLASDEDRFVSEGATWIINAELKDGATLSPEQVARLLNGLDRVTAWQAQLHVCQFAGLLEVPEALKAPFSAWLHDRLDAERPFLRAWALDALCHLLGPSAETDALLRRMETDKAASVRARLRNLKRQFGTKSRT